VDEAIVAPFVHGRFDPGARWRLGRELRARHYDRAIVLPNSFKSAIVPFIARARVRTGFVGELRYVLLNDARRMDRQKLPRTVDRFVALALASDEALPAIPVPRLQADADKARATLARSAAGAGAGIVSRRRIRPGQALAGGIFCRGGERGAR
jgi:heptosyltransferase-2